MKRLAWIPFATLGLLLSGADGLLGQAERLEGRLSPGSAARVLALADSARALSLPVEPLVQKALEGAAKGATDAEIEGAVDALLRDMDLARDILGDDLPEASLVLAAAALDSGLSPDDLAGLRERRLDPSLPAALGGLVYLLGRGVPGGQSADLVSEMLGAELPASAFGSLQRLVERDAREGAVPAESARIRAHALIRAGGPLGPGGGSGE